MNKYQLIALEQYEQIILHRRHLHANPELSFEEKETADYVAQTLKSLDIPYQRCHSNYGIVVKFAGKPGGRKSRKIGFRADMDALSIQEENETAYRSKKEGKMHACGHDGHTAVLLGLAATLKSHPEFLRNDVTLFFQPAEERLPGGAISMVEEGCADGLDSIFALHFYGNAPTGSVFTKSGPILAFSDNISIKITGKGGHAADPDLTRDALLTASQAVCALQAIVSRFVNPIDNAVISICSFQSGNGSFNVIQDKAELLGTVRSFSPNIRKLLEEKIHQVLSGVCGIFGTSYELDYRRGYPAVINNTEQTDLVIKAVKAAGYKYSECRPDLGGEDFAYFLEKVPGCFLYIGCTNEKKGINSPVHTATFDIDDEALLAALAIEIAICEEAFL